MNVVDAPSVEVLPVQIIPGAGRLNRLGKQDANPPDDFHSLLPSDNSEAIKPTKSSGSLGSVSQGKGQGASKDSASASSAVGVDRENSRCSLSQGVDQGPSLESNQDKDGVSSGVEASASITKDGDQNKSDVNAALGLSAEDAALDAAAFAAAALLAQAVAPEENSAASDATQATQEAELGGAPSVMDQSSIRLFQAAGRFGLNIDASASVSLGSVNSGDLASPEEMTASVGNGLTKGPPSLLQNQNTSAGGVDAKSSKQSPAQASTISNPNLQANKVVDAIASMSVATTIDANAIPQKGDSTTAPTLTQLVSAGDDKSTPADNTTAPLSSSAQGSPQVVSELENQGNKNEPSSGDSSSQGQGKGQQKQQELGKSSAGIQVSLTSKVISSAEPSTSTSSSSSVSGKDGGSAKSKVSVEIVPASSSSDPSIPHSGESKVSSATDLAGSSPSGIQSQGHSLPVEVSSKPVVEAARQANSNLELWKTISDAVQRVRSENPSHLAMEVRLRDGSSIGLELRMGAAGLEASFKAESHGLLKALESHWTAFIERQPSDLKVASTVFEGRSGLDFSSGGGGDAAEKREAFEDSAAAAALSTPQNFPSVELPSEESLPKLTPIISNGRLNLYA